MSSVICLLVIIQAVSVTAAQGSSCHYKNGCSPPPTCVQCLLQLVRQTGLERTVRCITSHMVNLPVRAAHGQTIPVDRHMMPVKLLTGISAQTGTVVVVHIQTNMVVGMPAGMFFLVERS
ncbi:uncharacterized protein LOC124286195 isoform X2 [Haliotis rubra]|uniref:uncharacterized protein LOC124286195 isoform X2 n=1 Tax=Haliotis rubra TaxID=36100 RepID=UPI001EE5E978|nr:uncharacterized protein LOC124286195 isoform X2 [Haliotis rubra]